MTPRKTLWAAASLALVSALHLLLSASAPSDVETLRPGVPIELTLDPDDPYAGPSYRVRVPQRATSLRLWTEGATGDVSLFVNFGSPPDTMIGDFALQGPEVWLDEELLIDVTDAYSLEAGNWYVRVEPQPSLLAAGGKVRCQLHAELIKHVPEPLGLGEQRTLSLRWNEGLRKALRVDAPSEGELPDELSVEVWSAAVDVDVLIGPPGAGQILREAHAEGLSLLPYERVLVDGALLTEGIVLHVLATPEAEGPHDQVEVRVLVQSADSTPGLCPEPVFAPAPSSADPLARALASMVAVFGPMGGGSGVLVSESGHILTNAHVVVGAQGLETRPGQVVPLAVGLCTDPRARVGPTLGVEILGYREDLDLALLRIATTLDGRPLTGIPSLPHLPPAALEELSIGDPLFGMGYPMTGGSGSLVALTLTHGVHSGWAHEPEGELIKTDAGTHAGASGGACLDSNYRLVGLPSSSIADANLAGGLGFVHPVSMLPPEWSQILGWTR